MSEKCLEIQNVLSQAEVFRGCCCMKCVINLHMSLKWKDDIVLMGQKLI